MCHTKAQNEFKYTPELVSSAVAAFASAYVLQMGDRHQGNLMRSGNYFCNIDFGWIGGEHPLIDAGHFPIPAALRLMLQDNNKWESFKASLVAALRHLHDEKAFILQQWEQLSGNLGLSPMLTNSLRNGIPVSLSQDEAVLKEMIERGTWTVSMKMKTFAHNLRLGRLSTM